MRTVVTRDRPPVEFGEYALDLEAGELRRRGRLVPLQPQPFTVLALLVERAGAVVSRETLKDAIWGADTYVDFDRGLNYCIGQCRAALGDTAETPRFIQTLPRRGYRFIGPVAPAIRPGAAPASPASGRRAAIGAAVGVAAIAALGLGIVAGRATLSIGAAPAPVVLAVVPFETLNEDGAFDAFGRGLSEETVVRLGRVDTESVTVIGNAPVLRHGGAETDIPRIRAELGADLVILGRIRGRSPDTRVTVHLIKSDDFAHLWTRAFDVPDQDRVAAQVSIAESIAADVTAIVLGRRH